MKHLEEADEVKDNFKELWHNSGSFHLKKYPLMDKPKVESFTNSSKFIDMSKISPKGLLPINKADGPIDYIILMGFVRHTIKHNLPFDQESTVHSYLTSIEYGIDIGKIKKES